MNTLLTDSGLNQVAVILKMTFSRSWTWIKIAVSFIYISQQFAGWFLIGNQSALLRVKAWHRRGCRLLSELIPTLSVWVLTQDKIGNYRQVFNIRRTLVRNKLVDHSDLHDRLNTWLQLIGQRQRKHETRIISGLGLGAPYIREFTVIIPINAPEEAFRNNQMHSISWLILQNINIQLHHQKSYTITGIVSQNRPGVLQFNISLSNSS